MYNMIKLFYPAEQSFFLLYVRFRLDLPMPFWSHIWKWKKDKKKYWHIFALSKSVLKRISKYGWYFIWSFLYFSSMDNAISARTPCIKHVSTSGGRKKQQKTKKKNNTFAVVTEICFFSIKYQNLMPTHLLHVRLTCCYITQGGGSRYRVGVIE